MLYPSKNPESSKTITRRRSSLLHKNPLSDSLNLDGAAHDAKSYRLSMHCFLSNLTKYYGKIHKDCLGELEDWYKIPLTK